MKTTRTGLLGSAMSFAHFAGLGGRRRAEQEDDENKGRKGKKGRAEDEDDTDPDAEDEDEPKDARRAEDEGDDEPGAEDDEDQPDAEDEDDKPDAEEDEEEPKSRKGKKARASKPPSAEYLRGRQAERRRCAKIFGDPAAARNVRGACQLAFESDMSAEAAIAFLKTTGSAAGADRAARNPSIGSSPSGEGNHSAQAGKGWDRALAKASTPANRGGGSGWGTALDKAQGR